MTSTSEHTVHHAVPREMIAWFTEYLSPTGDVTVIDESETATTAPRNLGE